MSPAEREKESVGRTKNIQHVTFYAAGGYQEAAIE